MILNELQLENFGLFYRKHIINFKPQKNKNLILIGGKNGNGKTTLFEAIRLCLYGRRSIDRRLSKDSYEKYLAEKIHHNPNLLEQPNFANISLEFQHSNLGNTDIYQVNRSWSNNGKGIKENFEIKKNQKSLEEIDPEQWQDFINDLIPPGLSKLFFFDGEKIQMLAEDTDDSKQLADSFKSLLGIDLVEKLVSDLEIYMMKELKQKGSKELQKKIENVQEEEKKYESKLDQLNQERAQIQSKIDKTYSNIERQEQIIAKEGGAFADKRDKLKQESVKIDTEISNIENQLRDYCADILPFAFAQNLSKRLKEKLIKEELFVSSEITRKNIKNNLNKIKNEISKKDLWDGTPIGDKDVSKVSKKIINLISDTLIPINNFFNLVHKISNEEHIKLLAMIDKSTNEAPIKLQSLCKNHEKLSSLRHKTERKLGFAPSDSVIDKPIKKVNELHHQLGMLQQKIKIRDAEIKQAAFNYDKVTRELRKSIEEMKNKEEASTTIKRINKLQLLLQEYRDVLEKSKIKQFSNLFIETYNTIARKKGIFEKVEINPQDYSVILYKSKNKKIPKRQLSEGEKQIYAIAVLWTFTKMSNRPLPFIIDTPLGRLDLDHRNNLVKNFFPKVSEQLIMLSTDTEIDKKYMDKLKPNTAKYFNLKYQDGETKIEDGYFWN